jgi:proteic killer suppression protein
VIRSFKDAETEKIYHRERSRKLPADIQQVALRKLRMINNAINLNDLRVPPANRLEKLVGNREGQHSIRINGASVSNGEAMTHLMLKLPIIIRRKKI